jgi:DNA-binding transcriptional ArsR family regulator
MFLTLFSRPAKYHIVSKKPERRELLESMDAYEAAFTALAHPVRRRILMTVNFKGGSMTAGEIADMFEHSWPTTTRHMQMLVSAGLLHQERKGRSRIYRIDRHRLKLIRDWLKWFSKDPK